MYDPEAYEGANDGKFVYNPALDCDERDLCEMGFITSERCPIHGVLFERWQKEGAWACCPECLSGD